MYDSLNKEDKKVLLAAEFAKLIREELDKGQLEELVYLNKFETDLTICHSREFCDANMLMYVAFTQVFKHEPILDNYKEQELMKSAWSFAKEYDFFTN